MIDGIWMLRKEIKLETIQNNRQVSIAMSRRGIVVEK